ncbi:nitrite reductase large subunit NirB [Hahella ganghwensis]|uniref:nitrite reductase large subunit NirB n=1 Tax=Hahella ganghwensis TaxID=286420 RepID=UPI00035F9559|nr:nitrite reductase large subunit NirB [Hahella ganghwensis]
MKQKLVVIGNGMAGMRTVEELLKIASDKYEITVFGAEPHGNYNRIMLSPLLSGEKTLNDIMINDLEWYATNNITLHAGYEKRVTKVDRRNKVVYAADGTEAEYDRLLLATGSSPFIIPVPGKDLKGVIAFRDISDVDTMLSAAKCKQHAIVIGGGLLGLEAANGLLKQGMDVTVVHNLDVLMNRQLDTTSATYLQKALEQRGMKFRMSANTSCFEGDEHGQVKSIKFDTGETLPADIVVMAAGIRPNTELAQSIGLYCERGIVVNDTMQTYDPCIYAVGECVQHRGELFGLVAPIWDQAKVCSNHLAGYGIGIYKQKEVSTKLKVTGIDLFSAGNFLGDNDSEQIVFQDPSRGIYKKLVLKDDRIIGSVLYGDTVEGSWYFNLMREKTSVADFRDALIFGQHFVGDAGHQGQNAIVDMPDDAEVCGCNGICKGDIVKAITDNKLFTLDDVRSATKASASCGSCTGLVEQILTATVGGNYSDSPSEKPICGCTKHSHDSVRNAITENGLKSFHEVSAFLEWDSADGCHVCRPAINYYLVCAWPTEKVDDPRSRFINERVHANIQKDNTYSVIPRMWGGVTTPDELRAIADAADKYHVPCVKVTGGQRIDLLGVKKEDLPDIWKDLNDAGMVSGHAYGKALRTVKTCVGSEFCRFGTQDSTGMGIKLEKMTWGSWTPAKVKMAVSGCPRNCAEATIKDFGVVAVDSGWELYVAGNGGIKVRACDYLCKVSTEEEVMEYAGAFMQMYREQGRHNERTAPWVERVGLSYIKSEIVENPEQRKAFHARFLESQKYAQVDPWAERASQNVEKHEFIPLTQVN